MSRGLVPLPPAAALTAPVAPSSVKILGTVRATQTQVSTAQQVTTVPNTLTNFDMAFSPAINLFDTSLGTLTAVHVTVTAQLQSMIVTQNTSTTSPAQGIFGFTGGSYNVTGLPTTVSGTLPTVNTPPLPDQPPTVPALPNPKVVVGPFTVPAFNPATDTPDFTGPTTVTIPTITVTDPRSFNFTSASDLAFFTASAGKTTISPRLIETGTSGAVASNGNLQTLATTSGSGTITVSYDYIPRCPAVVRLVRFGIHHQPTRLQLTFDGPVNPADAQNPNNYRVVVPNRQGSFTGPGVTFVAIASAIYNPANNTVLLTTAKRLNVHHRFQLQVFLPCNDGNTIVIEFGGKQSLGGFLNPHNKNQFVPVSRGKIVR